MSYFDSLTDAMTLIGKNPMTRFVGQSVRYDGHALYRTLSGVPMAQRIELPVLEDFQMGYSIGLSLQGYTVVSIYPRWDFLLLAANQLVNHLDKIPAMGGFRPKVIVRTAVGSKTPLDPGPQHKQNHTEAFRRMLHTVKVIELTRSQDVAGAYHEAAVSEGSFLLVEHMDLYQEAVSVEREEVAA